MSIEDTIRAQDPALRVDIPGWDSSLGKRIFAEARDLPAPHDRRVPRGAFLVVAGLAVAVAILIAVVLPGSPVRPLPAAAAQLRGLSARAATLPTRLGPGQFFYTETEMPTQVISISDGPGKPAYDEYLSGLVQTWVDSTGAGRRVVTTDPTPRFFTGADRQAWVAAGRPPAPVPPSQLGSTETFGPGESSVANSPDPLYDLTGLPTDPRSLTKVLDQEGSASDSYRRLTAGLAELDYVGQCSTKACTLFLRAAALLEGPDIGMTPALRSSLYRILSDVPGVAFLGPTTDPAGQAGVGFKLVEHQPARTDTLICAPSRSLTARTRSSQPTTSQPELHESYPATTTTFTIVVDPEDTRLLSTEETFDPSVRPAPVNPCLPESGNRAHPTSRITPSWTTVISAGVVGSDTATSSTGG
jgi:hypothetical protein